MYQFSQGKHNTQGHKGIPEGCFEEEQGRKGFYGQVSHLIKEKPSTRWTQIEGNLSPIYSTVFACPRILVLGKGFCTTEMLEFITIRSQKTPLPQNLSAMLMAIYFTFVIKVSGEVLTEYGLLNFRRGTYINIPKCVNHSFVCNEDAVFLVIESRNSSYREPDRGMVGRNAFYDSATLKPPIWKP